MSLLANVLFVDAGLWDLVSLSETFAFDSNKICQAIAVITEDGIVYSYSTEGIPDSKFASIVSILSAYCSFPGKHICVLRPAVEAVEKIVTENKNDDWFKPGGDL